MLSSEQFWNNSYKNKTEKEPQYDLWLEAYENILSKCKENIIDLGCGTGGDTLYLTKQGYKVIACDQSEEALSILKRHIPEASILKMDLSSPFPFENDSTEAIIADLSLHYFSSEVTRRISRELQRVLKKGGHLMARVNSINDFNYGAGTGEIIEPNYYLTEDGPKRYFSEADISYYFNEFDIEFCEEKSIMKYGKEKKAFEILARKK